MEKPIYILDIGGGDDDGGSMAAARALHRKKEMWRFDDMWCIMSIAIMGLVMMVHR